MADDEGFNLSGLGAQLRRAGIHKDQIMYCQNGVEAIQKFKESFKNKDAPIKIIFLDFNMPQLGGLEASKKMVDMMTKEYKLAKEDKPAIIGLTGFDI